MLWTWPDGGCPSSDWRKFSLKRKVWTEGGQVVAVSRTANFECHSSALHNRSQSVGTLTRNQRKVDFYCCKYKVSLSCPCGCLLLFFLLSVAALQLSQQSHPCPCGPGGLIRIACHPKFSWWIFTLLLSGRSLCSRNAATSPLVLAALGILWLLPFLPFEFMKPSLTMKTENGTLLIGCVSMYFFFYKVDHFALNKLFFFICLIVPKSLAV